MKAKYELVEDQLEVYEKSPKVAKNLKSIQSPKSVPELITFSPLRKSSDTVPEIPELIPSPDKNFKVPDVKSPRKLPTPQKSQPKLLNPTILPKIENKLRLKILTCDLCSHTTSTKNSLEKHMEIHIRNEKLYECQICHKKFAKKPVLMNHELTHKLSAERKTFQCKECGKHLSSQTALSTHIKWHHEEREFKCQICNKDFATVSFEGFSQLYF